MAKRHHLIPTDWVSVIGRLQELVMANAGCDEFEEIFKLVLAKIAAERLPLPSHLRFEPRSKAVDTKQNVNGLLDLLASTWPGVVPDHGVSRLSPEHLQICVETLQPLTLSNGNLAVLDSLFESLVNLRSKGSKGQFFTPRHVVEACVRLVDPAPGEFVLDPACGSGGFLVHAAAHMSGKSGADAQAPSLWGFDFDPRAVRLARAMLTLSEAPSWKVLQLNSLSTPESNLTLFTAHEGREAVDEEERLLCIEDALRSTCGRAVGFDVILTNPPFAGEIRQENILSVYELADSRRRIERDVLFLERCVQLLRPGGRLAIVLPHNKVGALQWASARDWLIKRLRIVAVVGLPRNTFLPHTHQKTSVLVGLRRPHTLRRIPKEDIFFAVSERSGKDSQGRFELPEDYDGSLPLWDAINHDLDAVVAAFQDFATTTLGSEWP